MFPYRDENETLRTAIVTGIFIALNVLVWIVVQGAGSTGARPIRLQSWAHSRRVNQLTSGRDKLSDWRWVGLRYRSWPSGFAFSNSMFPWPGCICWGICGSCGSSATM